ncbi:hypothetical protein [Desulfurispora thermophila]|uniref:hypothetical protein n=1 Tax=Desulfurispora thermophila TaxID=265470 RepID=UPI00036055D7|nr:hypothetical protein [Desulfurispora thermophila]
MPDFITVGIFKLEDRQLIVTDDDHLARLPSEIGFEEILALEEVRRFTKPLKVLERKVEE